MKIETDVLYYSNSYNQSASRITREFIQKFCNAVSNEFSSESTQHFIRNTFIPRERELYGLFVKALTSFDLTDDTKNGSRSIGHIGTEIKVKRRNEDRDTQSGRIDLIVSYRNVTFLIEFKVTRINLKTSINIKNPTKCRPIKTWLSVVKQVENIDERNLEGTLHKKIIKLPIVLYFYTDSRQNNHPEDWEERIEDRFFAIRDCENIPTIEFSYLSYWDTPIITKTRSFDTDRANTLYGFSIISTSSVAN